MRAFVCVLGCNNGRTDGRRGEMKPRTRYPTMTALDMDDPEELFELKVKYDAGVGKAQREETKPLVADLQHAVELRMKDFANTFLATF